MRPFQIAIATSLIALGVCMAEPPKVVPVPKPKADERTRLEGAVTGEMFQMAAEPASKWRLEGTPVGVDLRVFDNGKSGVMVAKTAGSYGVTVTGPAGDVTQLEIVVTGELPKPKPPEPMLDELKVKLKDAYDADKGFDKKDSAKLLVELYKQLAEKVCPDKSIATVNGLKERAHTISDSLLDADKLKGVRQIVARELGLLFPADGPLTDEQRKRSSELFAKLAVILEGM